MFTDTYKMILNASESIYKLKGSKFLGFAYPVKSESEIKELLTKLKLKYPDANHHCYAWVIGYDNQNFRSNDDGEPSNTAGKPILRQIYKLELHNILVVVIRYFGGQLLGISGLIQAYGETALECLNQAKVETLTIFEKYQLTCPFGMENDIYHLVKQFQVQLHVEIEATCFSAEIKIPLHKVEAFKRQLGQLYRVGIEYKGVE